MSIGINFVYGENVRIGRYRRHYSVGDNVSIDYNVSIGNNVKIGNNVEIEDGVLIGNNVIINDDVKLGSGCEILDNMTIPKGTKVNNYNIFDGNHVPDRSPASYRCTKCKDCRHNKNGYGNRTSNICLSCRNIMCCRPSNWA